MAAGYVAARCVFSLSRPVHDIDPVYAFPMLYQRTRCALASAHSRRARLVWRPVHMIVQNTAIGLWRTSPHCCLRTARCRITRISIKRALLDVGAWHCAFCGSDCAAVYTRACVRRADGRINLPLSRYLPPARILLVVALCASWLTYVANDVLCAAQRCCRA